MSENFEQQARQLLDDVQLEPRGEVWQHVKQAIKPKERRRRFIFWWLLPVALTAGISIYYINNRNNNTIQSNQSQQTVLIKEKNNTSVSDKNSGTADQPKSFNDETVNTNALDNMAVAPVPGKKSTVTVKREILANANKKNSIAKKSHSPIKSNNTGVTAIATLQDNNKVEKTAPVVPSKENTVTKSATDSVAKETVANKPADQALQKKLITDTTATTAPATATKDPQKKNKWSFGISVEAGLTTATEGGLFNFGQKALLDASTNPANQPTGGALTSINYQHTTASSKKSFGLYITAHRRLSDEISFQSSLGYRYQSFSILSTNTKDSFTLTSVVTYPLLRTSTHYQFNFINLYTGASFQLFKFNDLRLSIGAGIDNQFLFKAKQVTNEDFLFLNQNNLQTKDASLTGYNKWQPTLRLQLVADINSEKKKWLQLSPYFNFGLQSFEKIPSSSKKQLASFGLTASYFFK